MSEGLAIGLVAMSVSPAMALVMAGVLLWAGAEKLRDLEPTAQVVVHLGAPRRAAWAAACSLALVEIVVAVGLVCRPGSRLVIGAVMGLATLFATAGGLALRRGERIPCSCFGGSGTRYLGRAQLVAWPLWLGGSLLLSTLSSMTRPVEETTVVLALLATAMGLARVPGATWALLGSRGDRRAAAEIVRWLR